MCRTGESCSVLCVSRQHLGCSVWISQCLQFSPSLLQLSAVSLHSRPVSTGPHRSPHAHSDAFTCSRWGSSSALHPLHQYSWFSRRPHRPPLYSPDKPVQPTPGHLLSVIIGWWVKDMSVSYPHVPHCSPEESEVRGGAGPVRYRRSAGVQPYAECSWSSDLHLSGCHGAHHSSGSAHTHQESGSWTSHTGHPAQQVPCGAGRQGGRWERRWKQEWDMSHCNTAHRRTAELHSKSCGWTGWECRFIHLLQLQSASR